MANQPKEGKGVDFTQVEALNRRIRELEDRAGHGPDADACLRIKKALAIFSRQTREQLMVSLRAMLVVGRCIHSAWYLKTN